VVSRSGVLSYSFLAVSGSLRATSVNTEVLLAMSELSADDVIFTQYAGLGELPQFNPDRDVDPPPASVAEWRSLLQSADAVVICSPEYAHGVPGSLKNALDWVVGSGEFMYKPVSLINASEGSVFVGPQLAETLTVMMANIIPAASMTLSLLGKRRDALAMRLDSGVSAELRAVLEALTKAADEHRAGKHPRV
jgi:NAD(P)H-dependent FMN reductase